ncbi:hypothetical protein PR202_gb25409 [Eleusine coracana subsp. coracana]|uniref:Uncharacterized protein n=1 Tax=Eleusine coracana subsp. coracana TaxID=191504 RepID=A0AAV5FL46_ELECO|nr:hypothetical protein PR202_gb25409 [Eleusine coracana subsp. coracana]
MAAAEPPGKTLPARELGFGRRVRVNNNHSGPRLPLLLPSITLPPPFSPLAPLSPRWSRTSHLRCGVLGNSGARQKRHMRSAAWRGLQWLRYDDLYDPYFDLDIKEALGRLPTEVVDARIQRTKRSMDLSMKHQYLPEDLQEYKVRLNGSSSTRKNLDSQCNNMEYSSSLNEEPMPDAAFKETEDDSTDALDLDDHYIEAYSWRITARKKLGKLKEAMDGLSWLPCSL